MSRAAQQVIGREEWVDTLSEDRRVHEFLRIEGRVVYAELPAELTPESFADLAAVVIECSQGTRFPMGRVVDLRGLRVTNAKLRHQVSELERVLQPHDKKYLSGCALIANTKLQRATMRGAFWLMPPIYPYQLCGTTHEARTWVNERLDEWAERSVVLG